MVAMPETGWIDGEPEPDPPYDAEVVEAIRGALVDAQPESLAEVFEAAAEEHEHELRAALGLAMHDLNDQLLHASYDVGDSRRRDLAARIAELHRLTGT